MCVHKQGSKQKTQKTSIHEVQAGVSRPGAVVDVEGARDLECERLERSVFEDSPHAEHARSAHGGDLPVPRRGLVTV